jgi:hypothetical protein
MRATQQVHRGLLLPTTQMKEKNFKETHQNIFEVFDFSKESKLTKEKQK